MAAAPYSNARHGCSSFVTPYLGQIPQLVVVHRRHLVSRGHQRKRAGTAQLGGQSLGLPMQISLPGRAGCHLLLHMRHLLLHLRHLPLLCLLLLGKHSLLQLRVRSLDGLELLDKGAF